MSLPPFVTCAIPGARAAGIAIRSNPVIRGQAQVEFVTLFANLPGQPYWLPVFLSACYDYFMGAKKIRVAVLMGGPSVEHEVSLSSGKKIVAALDPSKYGVCEIVIGKDGTWPLTPAELKAAADIAFIGAMHGEYGEDGTLQKELGKIKMRYTGSGPRA